MLRNRRGVRHPGWSMMAGVIPPHWCPMSGLFRLVVPVVSLAAGAALVALHGGCSRNTAQTPTTVRGQVTFQGQPVAGGLVVFSPDPERGGSGKPARGDLGPDGSFKLSPPGGAALAPGWYRVAIAAAPAAAGGPAFPAKLARPDTSGLVREVRPGQENVFDFAVELTGG